MNFKKTKIRSLFRLILSAAVFYSVPITRAVAQSTTQSAAQSSSPSAGDVEKVDVSDIKQKYWSQGDETQLSVVQNRAYSKANRFQLVVFGGLITTDPFLNVQNIGGSFGYFFNEYFSLTLLGWKTFSSASSALQTFQDVTGATTNTNPPLYYVGGEFGASVLYGKLSLIGKSIIYFDLHLMAGLGATGTESGTYITPSLGIGQQIHLTRTISIKVDYRAMIYNEKILEKEIPTKLGQEVGSRLNWTHAITLGIGIQFGGGKK